LSSALEPSQSSKDILDFTMTRSVSFTEQTEVLEIESIDSMPLKEAIEAAWYAKVDYKRMKYIDNIIIRSISASTTASQECIRGLEFRTPEGSTQRRLVVLDAISAVMGEQSRQEMSCQTNAETLSFMYKKVTGASARSAAERGMTDSQDVNRNDPEMKGLWLEVAEGKNVDSQQVKGSRTPVSRFQKLIGRAVSRTRRMPRREAQQAE
jgi:hypothetical protein